MAKRKRRTRKQILNSPFNVAFRKYLKADNRIERNNIMKKLLPILDRMAYGIAESFKVTDILIIEEIEGIVIETFFRQIKDISVADTPDGFFYIISRNRVADYLRHHSCGVSLFRSTAKYFNTTYDIHGAPLIRSKSIVAYAED